MNETLRNTPTNKLFLTYLIPSLLGMLLMAVNILVDGIFVSNGIGPEALAGINIAVPIFSILLSISLWIGMGGPTKCINVTLYAIIVIAAEPVGVTSYAVVNYLHAVFIMLFIGIGAALQPIVSFHYGAKLYDRLQQFLRLGVITGILFGACILLVGLLFGDVIVSLFGVTSEEVFTYTKTGISMFFIGYLFLGFNLVYAEYYQAIKKIKLSSIIIVARSIVLFLPLLWLLPTYVGSDYIWLAFPLAEGITAIGLVIARYTLKALAPFRDTSAKDMQGVKS